MLKCLTIIGARPQFIKSAIVSQQFAKKINIEEIILHTGQHYDKNMSDIFFNELNIPHPKYQLNVGSGSHAQQTASMLTQIEDALLKEKPDWVLVYGDTNSTLAGALAASKLHIPIAHVEAGLRSFNRKMPEEINRIVTDHLSTLLFPPTVTGVNNLRNEGIPDEKVEQIGDVMYDAVLGFSSIAQKYSNVLKKNNLNVNEYILVTIHRAENTDNSERLNKIIYTLEKVAQSHTVIIPMHPRTLSKLDKEIINKNSFKIIEPLGYFDMLTLEKNASLIITDSGGVQKEAFFHRVPCVTLRDETEWIELIDLGWNRLGMVDGEFSLVETILDSIGTKGVEANPYGFGDAAEKVVNFMVKKL